VIQLNDSDPWAWFAIYLLCAGLWLAEALDRRSPIVTLPVLLVLIFWMGTLAGAPVELATQGTIGDLMGQMTSEKPNIEESREFLGLGICAISLLVLLSGATHKECRL